MEQDVKKWYNVELPRCKADELLDYLRNKNVYFEPSEAGNLIHVECLLDKSEVELVNNILFEMERVQ